MKKISNILLTLALLLTTLFPLFVLGEGKSTLVPQPFFTEIDKENIEMDLLIDLFPSQMDDQPYQEASDLANADYASRKALLPTFVRFTLKDKKEYLSTALKEGFTLEDIRVFSQSPDGNYYLGWIKDQVPFLYHVPTGKTTPVLFSSEVGLDENLTYAVERTFYEPSSNPDIPSHRASLIFFWSPDSRYMTVRDLLGRAQFVLDTQTTSLEGFFMVDHTLSDSYTYWRSMIPCFSDDSQTLYLYTYDQFSVSTLPNDVFAYSLKERTLLPDPVVTDPLPQPSARYMGGFTTPLFPLQDGGFFHLVSPPDAQEPTRILTYPPGQTSPWNFETQFFPPNSFSPSFVQFQHQSPKGVLIFSNPKDSSDNGVAFSVFEAKEGFPGIDQLIILSSFQEQQASLLPLDQSDPDTVLANHSLQCVLSTISPSGEEALLLLRQQNNGKGASNGQNFTYEYGLMRLNLTTLQATPVTLANEKEILFNRMNKLEWKTQEEVLITLVDPYSQGILFRWE